MNDILGRLSANSQHYPIDLSQVPPSQLNQSPLTALAKARLLQEMQKRYLQKGNLSPIEKFGQSTSSAMAQGDGNF